MEEVKSSLIPSERAEDRLRQLNALAIALLQQNTLDDLLWTIAERIAKLLELEDCVIYLVEDQTLVQRAAYGIKSPEPRAIKDPITIALGRGVTGTVALSGESKIVEDTRDEPAYIPDAFAGLSELAVPIRFEGRVIGVFDTEDSHPGRFDERSRDEVESLVNIAAPRIASALADRDRRRVEEALRSAHDLLEERVWERTLELSQVVDELKAEVVERQRSEAALKESEEKYRALFNRAADPIFIVDQETLRFLDCNRAALERYGYPLETLQSMTIFDLHPESDHAAIKSWLGSPKSRGPHPFKHVTREGTVIDVEIHTDDIHYQGHAAWIGVARDVTERRRAEAEQRDLEAKMRQAQKLESLGVLAGGIAHDFNNLLVGILGYAGLALSELPEASPHFDSVREIERAARRAAELSNQLLAYSGKGRFVVEAFDLNSEVSGIMPLLRASISKRAVIETSLAETLPSIVGDVTQLRQLLMNLIINASDALDDCDGTIRLRTGVVAADRRLLDASYVAEELEEGTYVHLEVSDTGCGMTAEEKDKIFDPFFTTKFAGRGLGMAAVLGIVRGHRGAIRIESELGSGSSFHVLLPASDEVVEDKKEGAVDLAASACGKVLVVDDEPAVRSLAQTILEQLGYEVVLAEDGRRAVDLFARQPADICLVLLDMTMPKLNGKETLRELRAQRADIKVVLSSGYNAEDLFDGEAPDAFIRKPYGLRELTRVVRETLDPP